MQRSERVLSLVCTVVCLRAWLLGSAYNENGFVDNIAHIHGCSMSYQRFALRPYSLSLHRTVSDSLRSCFARIWPRASASWTVRLEMDRQRNNYWRDRAHLHPRTPSGPLSTKWNKRGLTNR